MRPKKAGLAEQVEAAVRSLGRPEPGLLEAALEGADARRAQERALAQSTEQLIQQAFTICLQAHAVLQRCTQQQRVHLRGFSVSLLCLAAEQALTLDRQWAEYAALETERAQAGARHRELFDRNLILCQQARQVLEKVGGDAAAIREELGTEEPLESSFAVAQVMHRLAHVGHGLVRSPIPAVRSRAKLYGLDEAFLNVLSQAGAELVDIERKAADLGSVQAKKVQVERAQTATFILASQIVEAFEAAHRVDPQIGVVASSPGKVDEPAIPAIPRAPLSPHRDGSTMLVHRVPHRAPAPPASPPLRVVEPARARPR